MNKDCGVVAVDEDCQEVDCIVVPLWQSGEAKGRPSKVASKAKWCNDTY